MYIGTILKNSLRTISALGQSGLGHTLDRGEFHRKSSDYEGSFQNCTDVDHFTTLTGIGSYHLLGGGS